MKEQAFKILSGVCLTAGYASIVGSLVLWGTGRARNDIRLQNDGLFVGLWVPSFFILSDRLELAAHEAREGGFMYGDEAQETVEGRETTGPRVPGRWRDRVEAGSGSKPVQSPRPLQHTLNRE